MVARHQSQDSTRAARRRGARSLVAPRVLGTLLLALVALPAGPARAQEPGVPVAIAEIAENPAIFLGRTVTIQGELDEILAPRVLTIDNGEWLDTDLLVFAPAELGHAATPWVAGDLVRVTGVVHRLDWPVVEQYLGPALDPAQVARWEGQPVIAATHIEPALRLTTLTDDPIAYLGRTIAVRGEVERYLGPYAFTLDTPGIFSDKMLVLVTAPVGFSGLPTDEQVQVTGKVGLFYVADFEQDFGVDLDAAVLAAWEGQPVLVAWSVQQVRDD